MRIGMILDNEYLVDARVPNEARYLAQQGHEVYVLCINFDNRLHFETVDGVNIVRFNMSRSRKNILFGMVNTFPRYDYIWERRIRKFIVEYKIEALHAHDLYMARATYCANRKFSLPITLDLHENYPDAVKGYTWANTFPRKLLARPEKWKKKEYRYLSYADNIVVLSDGFKQTLCEEYPDLAAKNFAVYSNVPDVDWLLSFPIIPDILEKEGHFILLYFGVIGVRRGMALCFEALKRLVPDIPETLLLLIGPVDRADRPLFDSYMNDTTVRAHTIHFPWKDISELPSYITISDVCISPAINSPQHHSGIGNKIYQYMLFGRPLVVTNSKPNMALVDETRCGLIFEDLNVDDLSEKIKTLYHHPEMREELGRNGRKAVIEKYNVEIAGKELENLYATE